MKLQRRLALTLAAAAIAGAGWLGAATPALAAKDTLVLGMVLEPPSLDPTSAAAAAIGEVVHYNILEGLTKIEVDGRVTPLLAEGWTETPDGATYTFRLRKGVSFSDGSPLDAEAVKFSFERARGRGSASRKEAGAARC